MFDHKKMGMGGAIQPGGRTPRRFGRAGAALLAGLLCGLAACTTPASKQAAESAHALAVQARTTAAPRAYELGTGDKIALKFTYDPELNDTLEIRPDGNVSVQLIGDVVAAGRSVSEVTAELKQKYSRVLKDPEVTVNVETYRSLVAYIGGEVRSPGVVPLAPGMTVLQAIFSAGGYLRTSNLKSVLIIREQAGDKPQLLLVDVDSALHAFDAADDLRLRPRDVVVVPMAGVVKAGVIVQQYINDLLPFMKSFNVTYNFGIPSVVR